MERPCASSWSAWGIKVFGGESDANPAPSCSESEERARRIRQVAEEEHGDHGRQHDNREGDEHRGTDRPSDGLLRRAGLRLEDVHVPDHPRVVVEDRALFRTPETASARYHGLKADAFTALENRTNFEKKPPSGGMPARLRRKTSIEKAMNGMRRLRPLYASMSSGMPRDSVPATTRNDPAFIAP